jgi:hypothetical protein
MSTIIINCIFCCEIHWDFFLLLIGFVLSILATILVFHLLKPKILIEKLEYQKEKKRIKIYVKNVGEYVATNIKLEVALVLNKETFHLDTDRYDFILLEPDNSRIFKTIDINPFAKDEIKEEPLKIFENLFLYIGENCGHLRVRVHAHHGLSGFGKSFEKKYSYTANGCFTEIKK